MTTDFKQQNLDFIEAVGAWTNQSRLSMKRWSDEKNVYERGVLQFREASNTYVWNEGASMFDELPPTSGQVVSMVQIKQLVDDGWMVDN
jgi:hypothetical protein